MTIVEAVASTKLNPGASVPLKLSAGSVSLNLTGDAIASETDGTVNIEVSGPPNPRVFALLKAGPTLTIEVPGAKETIPLSGAAPHVAAFERMCLGRRYARRAGTWPTKNWCPLAGIERNQARLITPIFSRPSASNTLATMPFESRPAFAYIAFGES